MKYKQGEMPDIYYKIDGDMKLSFRRTDKPGTMGYGLYKEMIDSGLEIESQYTEEELAEKQEQENIAVLENQKLTCRNLLDTSEIHVSNDPPYPDDVEAWKIARNEWRKILKSDTLQEIYPKPFGE